ncbi:MAG: hypothetical protein U1E61_21250, partial [Bradyrhizobium sp.]
QRSAPMVDFAGWDVERVWHFLAGLCPGFREPLKDPDGVPVLYNSVVGFERAATLTAGTIQKMDAGWRLSCNGGTVLLGR